MPSCILVSCRYTFLPMTYFLSISLSLSTQLDDFLAYSPQIWNSIPFSIRSDRTLLSFKTSIYLRFIICIILYARLKPATLAILALGYVIIGCKLARIGSID